MGYPEIFKEYSLLEKKYAEELTILSENTQNPIIKVILKEVAQDSIKHSLIYETLLKLEN